MVEQEDKLLLVEKEPPIAWLKLHRPKVLNSLNRPLLNTLLNACADLAQQKDVRVVIIIGSGTKSFCSGADLTERKSMTQGETIDYLNLIQKTMRAIEQLPQPVIAAINGPAYGGGTELALACDLRMMVEESFLRLTEVKLGIIPGAGGTQRLPRLIGKSLAKELILTAMPLPAKRALEIGLAHRLVSAPHTGAGDFHEPLMQEARQWAQEIALAAPLSLRAAKQAIDAGYDRDLEAGLALETRSYLQLVNSRDRLEGLAAFAEKRQPVYQGE